MFRRDKRVAAFLRQTFGQFRPVLERVPVQRRLLIVICVCTLMVAICVKLLIVAVSGSSSSSVHIENIQTIRIADDSTELKFEEAKIYKRIEDSIKQRR